MPDFPDDVTINQDDDELVRLGRNIYKGDVVGGQVAVRDLSGNGVVVLEGGNDEATTSVTVVGGTVEVYSVDGSSCATLGVGTSGYGELTLRDPHGRVVAALGTHGNLKLGGGGDDASDGDLRLFDRNGKERIWLDADGPAVTVMRPDGTRVVELGKSANLRLGGGTPDKPGPDGDLLLNDRHGNRIVSLGADEHALVITRPNGEKLVSLGRSGNLVLGGAADADGDIKLYPAGATNGQDGSGWTMHLDGDAGDIVLKNADCAEDFDVAAGAEPGSVLVIGDDGRLHPAGQPYDTRVAGVVSGAGGLRPGIVLGREARASGRAAVALSGRVFCHADATPGPIGVGDLLTTSATTGHAMRAADRGRAVGAILGKALAPLSDGRGLVPILVGLQ